MMRGISYWSLENGLAGTHPIDQALQEARNTGFEALELCIGLEGVLNIQSTHKECSDIRRKIEKSGLVVETLACGLCWDCCLTDPRATVRREAVQQHKAALQRAAWLDCDAMLFVPGAVHIPWNTSYPSVGYESALSWAAAAIGKLLPMAERLGVDLCMENVWNGMFYSPLEFRDFIDAWGSEHFKAYFDVGNVLGYHQHPQDWIGILGPRIGRVHLKDFRRSIGSLAGFCDLGEGDVPWGDVTDALRRARYDKTLIAEMLPWRPGLLHKTARAMKRLLPKNRGDQP